MRVRACNAAAEALLFSFVIALAAAQSPLSKKDIPTIAKAASGAVVLIVVSDKNGQPVAQGSGFVVSKDGRIITNYHVIERGSSAVVKLPDGAFYAVDGVLAFDKDRDIAVIKAHGDNFHVVPLGDSSRVRVGDQVVAIGNPLSLESTVSNGIVSGIRSMEDQGGKFLQVTTPISPGSSGGPLFNMEGRVVGITTMYLKVGENLNFAIPIDEAKHLLAAKLSNVRAFPNEGESVESGTEEPSVPVSSARTYYKQWYAAGGLDEVPPSPYACFPDSDVKMSGVFFVFSAFALENKDVHRLMQDMSEEPYISFMPPDLAKLLMSPAAQEILGQGGKVMSVQIYSKGVRTR